MPAADDRTDAPHAWVTRAAQARRIAIMLSAKDAEAIEAYARECEAIARQTLQRQVARPLAA